MKPKYCPEEIELKVQEYWNKNFSFQVSEDYNREKYYCLSMLPYPSGQLHMGHVRNYTIGDVIARYNRMLGKNVLHPIGWDAFGLPAENAAIKKNVPPDIWTYQNISKMKDQLKKLGFSYDWSREIVTCSPEYYYWEQKFFIELYKKGLVYKKTAAVNWCKNDRTVLANEQVIKGRCWRCDNKIERKVIPQWFIKITEYAEELLNDLDKLEDWPETVKTMQRNWIGRSEGVEITFTIKNSDSTITVYTTRPDVLMGVTFIAISPEHKLAKKTIKNNLMLNNFINKFYGNKISEVDLVCTEKHGIDTNLKAIHPFTNEEIPIWITNFFGIDSNIDSCLGIPGHDERDHIFANKYKLEIRKVISTKNYLISDFFGKSIQEGDILFNSGEFDGFSCKTAYNFITERLVNQGIGKRKINYRLRDWCISRQRYWGTPIPMAFKDDGSILPIPDEYLPLLLPEYNKYYNSNNTVTSDQNWPSIFIDNQHVIRETDTFDTFIESSWYYARYTCPKYKKSMLDTRSTSYWLPVDIYIGGIEHAIMHLLYFRFFHKLIRDMGMVFSDEPVKKLICQGMVLADTFYYVDENGERHWVSPSNVISEYDENKKSIKFTDSKGHSLVYIGMTKMSKSKNNGVDLEIMLKKYGADTIRLFIMFSSPIEMSLQWKESGIEGIRRFLRRIWTLVYNHIQQQSNISKIEINKNLLNKKQTELRFLLHKTIAKVSDDIQCRQSFNTAISSIMVLVNKLSYLKEDKDQNKAIMQEALSAIIRMLYPFAPHISFMLWKAIQERGNIDQASWPVVDELAIKENKKLIIVQINGKVRKKITVPFLATEKQILKQLSLDNVFKKYVKKITIDKVIYIPEKKILNLLI